MINPALDIRLFNIDILVLNNTNVQGLQEVSKTNIFEIGNNVFDKDGLFSTNIFGPVGSEIRNDQLAYINLYFDILHPLIYENLISLKSIYKDIAEGKQKAIFSKADNDFILTTDNSGDTGYTFFIDNIHRIKFTDNDSDSRKFKIDLVTKYIDKQHRLSKWLVIPAGIRDYTIDAKGNPTEDEINNLYRKLLSTTSMVRNTKLTEDNIKLLDPIRLKLQKITMEIFEYIKTLLDGKNKFIQGKWAKRAITHGTRNVITPMSVFTEDLDSSNNITVNHTTIGLYQYIKAVSPIAINKTHTMFINKFLNPNTDMANLVNPKTMKTEITTVPIKIRDEWLSMEGMSSIMNKLSQEDLRIEPVKINKHYLMLIYDNGTDIKLYMDTANIEDSDREYIRPITYAELFYLSVYDCVDIYPGFLTRYPVAGIGGIYPSKVYLKTTYNSRTIILHADNTTKEIHEYPILTESFVASLSPAINHIGKLGADLI